MSTAPDIKRTALEGAIGPMDELERQLRERIAAAEDFIRISKQLLATMSGGVEATVDPQRYKALNPEPAAALFFSSSRARPLTKEELVDELMDGNVKTNAPKTEPKAKRGNVKRSIEQQMATGKIKVVGDKLGHPDWPDEKFNT